MTTMTARWLRPSNDLPLAAFQGIFRAVPLAALLWAGILVGTGIIH